MTISSTLADTVQSNVPMSYDLLNDPETAIREATQLIAQALIEIRRDIHAHPELAFEQVRTAGVVARELTWLGIPYRAQIARTGVVGLIEEGRPGPVLAIRADMDVSRRPNYVELRFCRKPSRASQ